MQTRVSWNPYSHLCRCERNCESENCNSCRKTVHPSTSLSKGHSSTLNLAQQAALNRGTLQRIGRRDPYGMMAFHGYAKCYRTAAVLDNSRILLPVAVMLVGLCLVATWMHNVPMASSIRPKRLSSSRNEPRAPRFVSLCPSNIDKRRLGNQLFNWAAILYVARLSGRLVAFSIV